MTYFITDTKRSNLLYLVKGCNELRLKINGQTIFYIECRFSPLNMSIVKDASI